MLHTSLSARQTERQAEDEMSNQTLMSRLEKRKGREEKVTPKQQNIFPSTRAIVFI